MTNNLAVLAGNGLSIAFNHDLNLPSITSELIEQLKNASDNGDQVVHAMNEIARRAEGDFSNSADDFEKLVGAFDGQSITLDELSHLAELVAAEDKTLRNSIKTVASFSQRVRDMGISHVLRTIMERSHADYYRDDGMHKLFRAIVDGFQGEIYIGNLNYDTLLMATLRAIRAPMCDMATGSATMRLSIARQEDDTDDEPVEVASYNVWPLRDSLDFPRGKKYRVKLLHMHGSLAYWHNTISEEHVKVPIEALREHDLWATLRKGASKWRPSVVLSNSLDKSKQAKEFPHGLAYEAFRDGLRNSNHWLIIGYSFRDAAVNEELRAEFASRKDKPSVLVCTYGDDPSVETVHKVFDEKAGNEPSWEWLSFVRTGAEGLERDSAWKNFVSSKVQEPAR